ncbi:MAG: Hsp70 family protein [Deltaproteobacteria bacterium]|nr:Hsp70 family protein [Deltaproteobacteria bacterium]
MNDEEIRELKQALHAIRDETDQNLLRGLIVNTARMLPKTVEFLDSFKLAYELLDKISDQSERRIALLDFVKEIPAFGLYQPLFKKAIDAALTAADDLDEQHRRTTELLWIANGVPVTDEFLSIRLQAWRLALDLPDKPRFREPSLEKIAKFLPKASDFDFFRRYTLLGIAKQMPKEGVFKDAYIEAIKLAIKASTVLSEPHHRRYVLLFIANEIPDPEQYFDIYHLAYEEGYKATLETKDPFAKQYGILEMLQAIPKTPGFFPLIQEVAEQALTFFTVKKWMEDVEVFDVVDYILSAEELGINDSKLRRFNREKYAKILSAELDKLGPVINDTRFIETLKPYTHVWIQPKFLRDAVKKLVEHLESLSRKFHGREIERPIFVAEAHPEGGTHLIHKKESPTLECISIDLGATNTVVMRKKGDAQPDYVPLPSISATYDRVQIVPTVLSSETNTIGTDVNDPSPIVNIKQMLLEGNPKGKEYMERFFKILYQHLKKATATTGWFSILPKNLSDLIYVTVPVGYNDYRTAMKEITDRVAKGAKIELIEEPLAAAVGYQVVEARDKVIMVIDFGGSTLNTMILRLNLAEVHIVAKPERAQLLGGHDIDVWLAEFLAKKADITDENQYKLITKAEEIKIELSKRNEVPFEWDGRQICKVTREELEEVLDSHEFYKIVDRTITNVIRRAEQVGLKKDRIEAILLTGGSSQIPSFKDKVGDIFTSLRKQNQIYDHSPLSAVGLGAALYGTRDITDRHLGMAYAVKYATDDKDNPYSYSILLEKGELLPLEKTYSIRSAKKLGVKNEVFIEFFEVPESLLTRRWVMEGGIEFIKQELKHTTDITLNALKTVTLSFKAPVDAETEVTLSIDEAGRLSVKYDNGTSLETGVRLQ